MAQHETYQVEGFFGPKTKTVCPEHRKVGYAYVNGEYACRDCGLPPSMHETIEETLARKVESQ